MPDMAEARKVMVDNQIRTFDVTDRDVLAAFDRVPRHLFLPESMRAAAYSDLRISLSAAGGERALLPPLILARLIQALQPVAGEAALDLFGGSGYSAAILAAIGLDVTAVEPDADLALKARAALTMAGASADVSSGNVTADGAPALAAGAFDVILVNGATEREPRGLFPLLRDGGRLGIIMRKGSAAQAMIYLRTGSVVSPRLAFDAQAPVLPGFRLEPGFAF